MASSAVTQVAPPQPFDVVAAGYDAAFTHRWLGRWLRGLVWKRLGAAFQSGQHVLELGCGTGQDAVWLARRGVRVTATDVSEEMLAITRRKACAAGVENLVSVARLDLAELAPTAPEMHSDDPEPEARSLDTTLTVISSLSRNLPARRLAESSGDACAQDDTQTVQTGDEKVHLQAALTAAARNEDITSCESTRSQISRQARNDNLAAGPWCDITLAKRVIETRFDGAFSSFGPLNCVADRVAVAAGLAGLVRQGGRVVLVVMGPVCPWEIAWHLARGRFKTAFRRFRSGAEAHVGDGRTIQVWYPSPRRLEREFAPWFKTLEVAGLGLLLPPSEMGRLVDRAPGFFGRLARLDRRFATALPWRLFNDHYLLILERR